MALLSRIHNELSMKIRIERLAFVRLLLTPKTYTMMVKIKNKKFLKKKKNTTKEKKKSEEGEGNSN